MEREAFDQLPDAQRRKLTLIYDRDQRDQPEPLTFYTWVREKVRPAISFGEQMVEVYPVYGGMLLGVLADGSSHS